MHHRDELPFAQLVGRANERERDQYILAKCPWRAPSHRSPDSFDKSMDNREAYLQSLKRRYWRFFTIDQIVWALYAASALVPAWGLLTYTEGKLFHATGIIAILSVAFLGYFGNCMLKRNNPTGRLVGYAATGLLLVSRVGILFYGLVLAKRSVEGVEIDWFGDLGILFAWVVCIVGFYRLLYHISAHFYVSLFIRCVESGRRKD
jgi:hypothetical protein